jgi:hypothetical protein
MTQGIVVGVEQDQAWLATLQMLKAFSVWLAAFNFREEVTKRELMCSFLPVCVEFFVTSQSTVSTPGNSGAFLSVGIIVVYDADGNVSVLKNFNQLLCCKVFNRHHSKGFIIFIT